ncbi:6120_t:CDS:2, partial [Gigaspora rosea]
MDDNYDPEFSNYDQTSDNSCSFDQDKDILFCLHSYSVKRVKLAINKDYFIKNFFESYKKSGIRSEDKPITKVKSSSNIHYITRTSFKNKTAEDLKKSSQQILENVL